MRKSFDQLKRISLLLTAIYVALVLFPVTAHAGSGFFGAEANRAAVLVYIDKTNQQMTVSLDGAERYRWPVSTGRAGYSTPSGTYTATFMNENLGRVPRDGVAGREQADREARFS